MSAAEIDEHIARRYEIKRRLGKGVSFSPVQNMHAQKTKCMMLMDQGDFETTIF
jgi:hypothetical protein